MARFFLWVWSRESPARLTRKKRKLCAADSGPCPIPLGSLSLSAFRPPLLRTRAPVLEPGGLPIPEPRRGPLRLPTPRQRLPTILGKLVTLQITAPPALGSPSLAPAIPASLIHSSCSAVPTDPPANPHSSRLPRPSRTRPRLPDSSHPARVWGCSGFQPLEGSSKLLAPRKRRPEGRQKPGDRKRTWSRPANLSLARGAPSPELPAPGLRRPARESLLGSPAHPARSSPPARYGVLGPRGSESAAPLLAPADNARPATGPSGARRRGCALAGPGRGRAASFPGLNTARAASLRALPALPQLLCTLPPSLAAPCLPPPCCLPLSPPCCLPLSLSPPCPVAMNNTLAWGLE